MNYNFDEIIDRNGTDSVKWDAVQGRWGRNDLIPMWVADMDFRTAQPIIDACRKKAEEGIWGYTSRPASYFEAVREWEEKRNQWNPDTRLMSWAIGVLPAMATLIKLFTKKRDRILFQTPVYS